MDRIDGWSEEDWFACWAEQLKQAGFIHNYLVGKEVEPLTLFKRLDRVTDKKKVKILDSVTYKCDVLVYWTAKAKDIFFQEFSVEDPKRTYFWAHKVDNSDLWCSPAEIKAPPGYGGMNTSDASFTILHKWVYDKFGIMINKVYNKPTQVIKYPKTHIVKGKKVPHPQRGMFKRFKNPDPYLWMMTFCPERYLYTDKKLEPRRISTFDPITLEQFLASKAVAV